MFAVVAVALKCKVEEGGGQEDEGAGTSEVRQVHGLSQEKDDDDVLPDESPAKRKRKSKKEKAGDQGASASKTAPLAARGKGSRRVSGMCGCGSQIMPAPPAGRCPASSYS